MQRKINDAQTMYLISHSNRNISAFFRAFIFTSFAFPALILAGCGCSSQIDKDIPSTDVTRAEEFADTEGYSLVWSDEFDGKDLNAEKWRIEDNGSGCGNAELEYYNESGVSVCNDPDFGNSALKLTARREQYKGKSFVSGRINTSAKFEFTYGKVEAKIRLPKTADGLWPAFWLLGADYSTNPWPRCGEIDILEMGNANGISSGTQETFFNGACHWGYYKGSAYPNYAKSTTLSHSIQDGQYHTFTLIWDEQLIRMYLDMETAAEPAPYYEMAITNVDDDWGTGHYFHHDFFIILNRHPSAGRHHGSSGRRRQRVNVR